jgi:hypothetical protein
MTLRCGVCVTSRRVWLEPRRKSINRILALLVLGGSLSFLVRSVGATHGAWTRPGPLPSSLVFALGWFLRSFSRRFSPASSG